MMLRRVAGATSPLAVTVLVGLALSACAGSADDSRSATATPSGTPTSSAATSPSVDANGFPVPTRPDCAADAGGQFVVRATPDGRDTGVLVLGHGRNGVVLAPQSDGDICQWLPFGRELARHYRVALFDWGVAGRDVPRVAVEDLHRLGVRRIVLAGASLGGAYALADAHTIRPRLGGVMSFSGELTLRGGFDGRDGIRAWHGPLLALGSAHDGFFDRQAATVLAWLHPGPETVVVVPGNAHGVDLLTGPSQARIRAAVDTFLHRTLG
jgi:pimeloyl-ACP methyl ester carboxylesterase